METDFQANEECGHYETWFEWGDCSQTCGVGTQVRTRDCVNGICDGRPEEIKACEMGPCGGELSKLWLSCWVFVDYFLIFQFGLLGRLRIVLLAVGVVECRTREGSAWICTWTALA